MALTATELAQLQTQLQQRGAELRAAIRKSVTGAGHDRPGGEVHDRGDEAEADLQRDTDFALSEIGQQALDEIDGALARISDGSYGRCISCGSEIAAARLQRQPAASRCINCQEALERQGGREPHRL